MAKTLLIGGPGNISTSAIELLLERGHEVAVFTLPESPRLGLESRVKFYPGDRNNPAELAKALGDFKPRIVADFCCFTPAQAEGLVPVLRGKLDKFVFVSTVDIYGYPLSRIPFAESDPRNPPVSQYAADKLRCEGIFGAEHETGALPTAVIRPSYSFGPSFVLNFFSRRGGLELVSRLRAGKPVVVPGNGASFIHAGSAFNTGRMIAEVMLDPATVGQDFTCAHASVISADDYYRLFARALGVEPRIVHIPPDLLVPLEMKLIPDNLLSELTQFSISFSVEKFRRWFPTFAWTKSLDDAAREYVAYHDRKGSIPAATDSYEDRLVQAWEAAKKSFKI